MLNIKEYIQKSKEERQTHLKLSDSCIDRGSPKKTGVSFYCKGLMAHILDTTIPAGHKILLCHACNNDICCNPNHLYWGTAKENVQDSINCGTNDNKNIWERMIKKYGLDEARKMQGRGNKAAGGKAGAGKSKSDEHKQKLSESIKKRYNEGLSSGRPPNRSAEQTLFIYEKYGVTQGAILLGISSILFSSQVYRAKNRKK
jgi:hypothetical protein